MALLTTRDIEYSCIMILGPIQTNPSTLILSDHALDVSKDGQMPNYQEFHYGFQIIGVNKLKSGSDPNGSRK